MEVRLWGTAVSCILDVVVLPGWTTLEDGIGGVW
jgi:hypothetical protein